MTQSTPRPAWAAAFALAALAACPLRAQDGPLAVIETLDEEIVGRLDAIDPERDELRLSQDSFVELPLADVLTVRFPDHRPPTGAPPERWVRLVDGSRFAYSGVEHGEAAVTFGLRSGGELHTPVEAIRDWALGPLGAERLDELDSNGTAADLLLVRSRDGASVSAVEGVVLGVNAAGVAFALDPDDPSEPVTAPWERVAGVRFYRGAPREAAPYAIVAASGDRFAADRFRLGPTVVRWSGAEETSGRLSLEGVAEIDLSADRVTPVALLPIAVQTWSPLLGVSNGQRGYALETALRGEPLRLRFPDPRAPHRWPGVATSREFDGGVAMRSGATLRLELPDGARRLKGWVGLDPATADAGDAVAAIEVDGREAWSGRVNGETTPHVVGIDLAGARELTLRVDYGENLDAGDYVHFADLRVIR